MLDGKIERSLGAKLPISIGTAMIFENPNYNIAAWDNILYVNLRTLYRNYVASYPAETRSLISEKRFLQGFLDEVAEFERIVLEESNRRVTPYFFYPKYTKIKSTLPKVEVKEYNPSGFDQVERDLWKYVKNNGLVTPFLYETIDHELPATNHPITLLSSFVVDLMSASNFPKVTLLESYTGRLKKRHEWYTKINFNKGKNNPNLKVPFTKFTIQIFGDKSGALKGADVKLRNLVREIAEKDHWSPVTSMDKIKYSIQKIKDGKLRELLFSYL